MNEQSKIHNPSSANDLGNDPITSTAFWECAKDGDCRRVTEKVTASYLERAWLKLPPHIQEAIIMLVDAALSLPQVNQ